LQVLATVAVKKLPTASATATLLCHSCLKNKIRCQLVGFTLMARYLIGTISYEI